jgi:glutaredoxin
MIDEENSMDITLLYFPDCPHWQTAHRRLTELVAEGHDATLSCIVIDTDDAARAVGFRGSPTIHIDGIDPFGESAGPTGLSCRLYPTPDGYTGSPTLEQLRDAVLAARRSHT